MTRRAAVSPATRPRTVCRWELIVIHRTPPYTVLLHIPYFRTGILNWHSDQFEEVFVTGGSGPSMGQSIHQNPEGGTTELRRKRVMYRWNLKKTCYISLGEVLRQSNIFDAKIKVWNSRGIRVHTATVVLLVAAPLKLGKNRKTHGHKHLRMRKLPEERRVDGDDACEAQLSLH